MIPTEWRDVHRPDDGELVGHLAPTDGDDVVPVSLAGTALGPAQHPAQAVALLTDRGLAVLAGRWWCRLPDTLPAGVLDAASPGTDWSWRPVLLVEVSPAGCRVRPEAPEPGELNAQALLPVPVGDLLRTQPG